MYTNKDYCPGTADFRSVTNRAGVFEGGREEIEVVGFTNCGECPVKKLLRARKLVDRGTDTVAFAS